MYLELFAQQLALCNIFKHLVIQSYLRGLLAAAVGSPVLFLAPALLLVSPAKSLKMSLELSPCSPCPYFWFWQVGNYVNQLYGTANFLQSEMGWDLAQSLFTQSLKILREGQLAIYNLKMFTNTVN